MKHALLFCAALGLFYSCGTPPQRKTEMERCKVLTVESKQRYDGTPWAPYYSITTSCGYHITSSVCPNVGDTIDVQVIYMNSNSKK
jgi:hypothetical protein